MLEGFVTPIGQSEADKIGVTNPSNKKIGTKLMPMMRLETAPTGLGYIAGVKNLSEKPKTK
ncbi:hypothetical protein C6501_03370 [Candidatus Poribacteria bacterium]|nr:MAG: hypothetical protein C6501_03370 [Candidatus Poribacteria bacterium]